MCGLVGMAGNLAFKDEKTMKRLLILDYFRGTDSTGLGAIRLNDDVHIAKVPSHPLDLFDMSKFRTALNGNQSKVFIGHNRAATRGVVNSANTHPFRFGHIVGAHNGTLDTWNLKDLEEELGEKFPVDSQALFAGIAKFGLKDTMSLISGAWSIVYYDLKEGTLNFLRNKERPLYYAFEKNFRQLFWASEWPMIESATQLESGYELYKDDEGYRFFRTDENVHYKFDINELRNNIEGKHPKPVVRKVEGKKINWITNVGNSYDPFRREEGKGVQQEIKEESGGKTRGGKKTKSPGTSSRSNVIELIGRANAPLAGYLKQEQFEVLAKHGCAYCQADIIWGDKGIAIYERDDIILCSDCAPHSDKTQNRVYAKNIAA